MNMVAWGLAIVLVLSGSEMLFQGNVVAGLGLVSAGIVVILLIAKPWNLFKPKVKDIRNEIAALAGNAKFVHVENDTAIALNEKSKEVFLVKPSLMKKYTYADIREWTVKEQSAGETVGIDFASAVAAAGANSRAEQAAMANTGLFIRVKDIDHPEWRVSMFRKDDRNRWFEILTQEINEGGIAA